MQIHHPRRKDNEEFLIKNESGAVTQKFINDLFFNFSILILLLAKVLNIVLADQNRNM